MSTHENAPQIMTAYHEGPLPVPEELARYDEILPGAAERIMAIAESQLRHRQELEKQALQAQVQNSRNGQLCATVTAVSTVIAGALGSIFGNPIQGTIVGLAGIVVPAIVYAYGKRMTVQELIEKQKLINQIK